MSTQCGLTIVKRFPYRDIEHEEYSNTYWFQGAPPEDEAAWRDLFDSLVATEKTVYPSFVEVIRGYGYNDNDGHKPGDSGAVSPAVWSVDLRLDPDSPIPGTLATGGIEPGPGDSAVWVRWKTGRRTATGGRPIYLRKYFHPAIGNGSDADLVETAQKTALLTLGGALKDGVGTAPYTISTAGEDDEILSFSCSQYIGYRQLRRGRRRPT